MPGVHAGPPARLLGITEPMKTLLIAVAIVGGTFGVLTPASAQKEAMGMMYEMQIAPKVCGWTDAADPKKLDATVAAQERGLGVSASERAAMLKTAEADLRSDPSNCAADGMVRAMYDGSVK